MFCQDHWYKELNCRNFCQNILNLYDIALAIWLFFFLVFNPFSTNVPLLYPLKTSENHPVKTSENLRFSNVFRGYRSRILVENGLSIFLNWNVCKFWKSIFQKKRIKISSWYGSCITGKIEECLLTNGGSSPNFLSEFKQIN